jgi:hypothetical protein
VFLWWPKEADYTCESGVTSQSTVRLTAGEWDFYSDWVRWIAEESFLKEEIYFHTGIPSTMLSEHLVGMIRVSFNRAAANSAANSSFVRSRPPMMSI